MNPTELDEAILQILGSSPRPLTEHEILLRLRDLPRSGQITSEDLRTALYRRLIVSGRVRRHHASRSEVGGKAKRRGRFSLPSRNTVPPGPGNGAGYLPPIEPSTPSPSGNEPVLSEQDLQSIETAIQEEIAAGESVVRTRCLVHDQAAFCESGS